ncbi:hypothetical protein HNY73_016552 [Argiope bruennichi]|uniref:Uncharacterized protein n=1 Tax=Argiope bruennichi TaxID=94029 RepID=A0A8T0EJ54_ARGBR|nr:hypothetical protein HNY73_016552 [Argiope bruennichi]
MIQDLDILITILALEIFCGILMEECQSFSGPLPSSPKANHCLHVFLPISSIIEAILPRKGGMLLMDSEWRWANGKASNPPHPLIARSSNHLSNPRMYSHGESPRRMTVRGGWDPNPLNNQRLMPLNKHSYPEDLCGKCIH